MKNMRFKTFMIITVIFVFILILTKLYISELDSRKELEKEMVEWKTIAETERDIPLVNDKASKFVNALHQAEHQEYLTGHALKIYKNALNSHFEEENDNHDHEHNQGYQVKDIDILLTNTESINKTDVISKVLYQYKYNSETDNEGQDVAVNQQILTLLMKISWTKVGDDYLVEEYTFELLEDTFGHELPLKLKGSENSD